MATATEGINGHYADIIYIMGLFNFNNIVEDKMYDWIENIDNWVKYVALGVDMRRFAFFEAHTPNVAYSMNRTPHGNFRDGVEVDEATYQKCRRFVVDTALALMQDDFDFDPWNNRKFN